MVISLCQNPRRVCVSHFLGQMLGCTYTICSYGQISVSCTIPSGLPSLLLLLLLTRLRVSHTVVSWWFLTGVLVTPTLLKYQGGFSEFWLIIIILVSKWSILVLLFPSLLVTLAVFGYCFKCTKSDCYLRNLYILLLFLYSSKV